MRPRLVVITPNAVTAVRSAGGWLFDRVMSGWDVVVLCPDHSDFRALQILGARPLESARATVPTTGHWPEALAVEADLFASTASVQQLVQDALESGTTDVRLWEGSEVSGAGDGDLPVQHQLSLAAQAFKAQALKAAAQPAECITIVEQFRSTGVGVGAGAPIPFPRG